MSRRVALIGAVLVVLLAGYVGISSVLPTDPAASKSRPDPRAAALARVPGPGSDADRVVLTLVLPAQGEPLTASSSGHGPGCPQSQVSALLGIMIAKPHGILVARVTPGAPAAEAGIVRGDSIVECDGEPVTCPSKLLPLLERGEERRPVKLTVLR